MPEVSQPPPPTEYRQAAPEEAAPAAPAPSAKPRHRRWPVKRAAHWAAELATVFVGVYLAFWLNNYQSHRQGRQRREQILAGLEADYAETLTSIKNERAEVQNLSDAFNRQVEAGEMPPLHAFNFATDYDASDTAGVLGSGGYDLLEVETVREIRAAESTQRLMIGLIRHDQQLSDALILPNLEKDPGFFYDPATKRLRPAYRWYADLLSDELKNYNTLQRKVETLLTQIRAERRRNR